MNLLTTVLGRLKIGEFIKTNEGIKAFENLQRDVTNIYNQINTTYTVSTLPSGILGLKSFVIDATATTFNSIVVGGGANKVPVFYDGTSWRIG
jgi:hypothetical protein